MSKIPQKGPGGRGGRGTVLAVCLVINFECCSKFQKIPQKEPGERGGGGVHLSSKEKTPAGSWGEGAFCLLGW